MSLLRLDISDFRNLTSATLAPIPCGFNLIYGNNGSGKTSLLEAIYYLSLGRSFRSSVVGRVIGKSAEKMAIFAQILTQSNQSIPVGIERHQEGDIKIRIAGKDVPSIAELAALTPVQLINSHCHNLLDAGPSFRRRYLDWGAFYLAADFLRLWRQFERALKQRNAALRGQIPRKELDAWTEELIEKALQLDQFRQEYTQRLFPLLIKIVAELVTIADLEITYQPGWDKHVDYRDILAQSIDKDMQFGHTQLGPHKADLKVSAGKFPAKDILSRGQQKLFVCAMILAQGALLRDSVNKQLIYLVDDLPSELDETSRSNLVALLSKQEAQVFVTAVERNIESDLLTRAPVKVFHVEHGQVIEIG